MRRLMLVLLGLVQLLNGQSTDRVVFSGSLRSRVEAWDWFEGAANNSYVYSGNILKFGASQQKKRWDWQIELAAPFLLALPSDAVSTVGAQGQLGLGATYYVANNNSRYAGMAFPKQTFLRYKRGRHSFRSGRFEFQDGMEMVPQDATLAWVKRERVAQRLIGPFGWSHVGRSFDGSHYA